MLTKNTLRFCWQVLTKWRFKVSGIKTDLQTSSPAHDHAERVTQFVWKRKKPSFSLNVTPELLTAQPEETN